MPCQPFVSEVSGIIQTKFRRVTRHAIGVAVES